jgi:DNA-binding CsgD family transcriptional regulator
MASNLYKIVYVSRIVFYFLLLIPIFVTKKKKYEKDSLKWNIQKMSLKTAIIVILFIVFLPFVIFILAMPYITLMFWAIFTLVYQVPGLLYCKRRLFRKVDLFQKVGVSSLTKRENEVALAICKGYKYEEIAQKLYISLSAVKKHSYNIYRKLGINNNRELMHIFMEAGNDTGNRI